MWFFLVLNLVFMSYKLKNQCHLSIFSLNLEKIHILKGVLAKNEREYRLTSKNSRWWLLLILPLYVASIRRKLLKTSFGLRRFNFLHIDETDKSNFSGNQQKNFFNVSLYPFQFLRTLPLMVGNICNKNKGF